MTSVTLAYALAINGLGPLFATSEVVTDAWAQAGGFTRVHHGLRVPESVSAAASLRNVALSATSATFVIDDLDGTMAGLFAATDADASQLDADLGPGDVAGVALQSKHVGTEAIGPAGERAQHSAFAGYTIGQDHVGTGAAFFLGRQPAPVTESPLVHTRRVALYEILVDGGELTESFEDARPIWWGVLRDSGQQEQRTWTLDCEGPEALLHGVLNLRAPNEALAVRPLVSLAPDERTISASISIQSPGLLGAGAIPQYFYGSAVDDSTLGASEDHDSIVAAFDSMLGTAAADVGSDGSLNGNAGDLYCDAEGIQIEWDKELDGNLGGGSGVLRVDVKAHIKVWLMLGYDPREQAAGLVHPLDTHYGEFMESTPPGYWHTSFYSCTAAHLARANGFDDYVVHGDELDNFNWPRAWPYLYPTGASSLDAAGGQEILLESFDPVHVAGTLDQPPAGNDDQPYTIGDDVGDVTHQRLFVFWGPHRELGDGEIETIYQVARVSWKQADDGSVEYGTSSPFPRFYIDRWLDPRLFGFPNPRFSGAWMALAGNSDNAVVAAPLAHFGYRDAPDQWSIVLQRLLLSSGTAGGWFTDDTYTTPAYGSTAAAVFEVGDNDTGGSTPKDGEIADLGLSIPASLVADPSDWYAQAQRVAADGEALGLVKVATFGPTKAADVWTGILEPLGLAWGLRGGRYGVFSPFDEIDDFDYEITPEAYAIELPAIRAGIPNQTLRYLAPIDNVEVSHREHPVTGEDTSRTINLRSSDVGAAYRVSDQTHAIAARWQIWRHEPNLPGAGWETGLRARWHRGTKWWARRHFLIQSLPIQPWLKLWPGDRVRLTDPWLVDPAGLYGVTGMRGVVLAVNYSPARARSLVDILIHAGTAETVKYAPAAKIIEYDDAAYQLTLEADYLDIGNGHVDADGFAEPSWSSSGGNADVEILQWNGREWTGGTYGSVSSIAGNVITLAGPLTGATYYRDTDKRLIPRGWADQTAAWVRALMAPITESDGTHSGGTPGVRFQDP